MVLQGVDAPGHMSLRITWFMLWIELEGILQHQYYDKAGVRHKFTML